MTDVIVRSPADRTPSKHPPTVGRDMLRRAEPTIWGIFGGVVVIAIWYLIRARNIVPESGLPGPWDTFRSTFDLVGAQQFRTAYVDTIGTWAKSLVLATVIAVAVGLAVGWIPWLARSFSVPMHLGRSIPSVTLIPVAIVLFGLGPEMKLAIVTFTMSWLILMNTIYGVQSVDRMNVLSARSQRFTKLEMIRRVLIPSALPSIMTGIRVAAGVGFVVTLSAELLGASTGIGTVMLLYQNAERAEFVYAGVLLVALTGMVLTYVIQIVEGVLLPWRPSTRTNTGD